MKSRNLRRIAGIIAVIAVLLIPASAPRDQGGEDTCSYVMAFSKIGGIVCVAARRAGPPLIEFLNSPAAKKVIEKVQEIIIMPAADA